MKVSSNVKWLTHDIVLFSRGTLEAVFLQVWWRKGTQWRVRKRILPGIQKSIE
jgi:hypothetical protein